MDILADIRCEGDVADFVAWCGRNGVDMAFPCVNHISGLVAYPSGIAPRAAVAETWDPTAAVVSQCRLAGIETHVWVCIGNWGRPALDPARVSARGPRPLQEEHPDWFCTDHFGRSMLASGTEYAFLNIANPEVRQFHLRLCGEILDRYPFDGYHLDYIRYTFKSPGQTNRPKEAFAGSERSDTVVQLEDSERFSFDEASLRAFQRDTGVDVMGAGRDLAARVRWLYGAENGGERRERWYAWKSAMVTEQVRMIAQATRARGKALSAAVFSSYPWCGQEVAQRWPGWVDERLLDLVAPMDYGVPLAEYPEHLRKQTDAMRVEPKPAVPMISGILSWGTFDGLSGKGAADLLRRYEDEAKAQGRTGISLYCYKSFRKIL
jgi:uncharacterized lipoprotein YddW (UPF0748 family)